MRPVVLIIRDGWGVNEYHEGNSVVAAKTPVIDQIRARYPHCLLDCCGEAVGLPDGYQGSSEVGHLNMGAGRIVVQELKRIDDGLSSGELFKSPKWANLMENWKKNASQLHFFGLLQDEGVHAHQEHLFKLMKRARQENPAGKIVVHPFLDGRDTPPRSTLEYVARLKTEMAAVGNCTIGTVMGVPSGVLPLSYSAFTASSIVAALLPLQPTMQSYASLVSFQFFTRSMPSATR